jgi:serine/threonine protein phosphatase PrpC
MPVKIFQLHKRSSYTYSQIQDKFSYNEGLKVVSIADGTTQSFRSELWANLLTEEFVLKPHFDKKSFLKSLEGSFEKFKKIDFTFSSNTALAYLEKQKMAMGATSTLMGLKFDNNALEIISCGDGNVFIVNDKAKLKTLPFADIEALDNNKSFINTEKYTEIEEEELYYNKVTLDVNDKVIICTDALSRLLLQDESYLQQIVKFKNYQDFFDFCISLWDAKKMQEDDITLVVVDNPNDFTTSTFVPSANFEFEKEKEFEFIPTPLNENEMNDYKELIEALRKEFYDINTKITKLESIFKFLLIITVINLALNVYVSYGSLSGISGKLKEQLKFQNISNPIPMPGKPKEPTPPPAEAPKTTPVSSTTALVAPTPPVPPSKTAPVVTTPVTAAVKPATKPTTAGPAATKVKNDTVGKAKKKS